MMLNIILSSPGQIAFHIGTWPIRWYGICMGIAFYTVYIIIEKQIKKNNLDLNHFSNLMFITLISSVVFARLWFVGLNFSYFKYHINEIPMIWLGGQSIHGGILGGLISIFLYSRFCKISFYSYVDLFATIFPLGQAIGRWGNFFNNEAFGLPINNSFIKLFIPSSFRPIQFINYDYFHPTFLYESFFDFIIFVFLFKNYNKWKMQPGYCLSLYLILYSSVRYFIEFVRIDSLFVFNIPCAQLTSIILFTIGFTRIYYLEKKRIN